MCTHDGDCPEDHYCIRHMWQYNGQTESGRGCWRRNICTGTATYTMFEERDQQYFCSEEQFAENLDRDPPENWNLVPRDEKVWDEFEAACETDADCPRPDLGQVCTKIFWQATRDGSNFANGESCYSWEAPVCPGKEFSSQNYNYDNTGFS